MRRHFPFIGCLAIAAGLLGCASQGTFKTVEFQAPSLPDPALRPLLEDVERIGVLSITNIDPFRELDIEKVMARMGDAIARGLSNRPRTTVVSQDEITWHFKDMAFDSTNVFTRKTRTALREEMKLDALVFVELNGVQARMAPVSPSPYAYGGLTPNPSMNMSVDLQVSLINLHSGKAWQRQGRQRNWQPIQISQLMGAGNQTERQLMMAMAGTLRQFFLMVAPPPRLQARRFEISGN